MRRILPVTLIAIAVLLAGCTSQPKPIDKLTGPGPLVLLHSDIAYTLVVKPNTDFVLPLPPMVNKGTAPIELRYTHPFSPSSDGEPVYYERDIVGPMHGPFKPGKAVAATDAGWVPIGSAVLLPANDPAGPGKYGYGLRMLMHARDSGVLRLSAIQVFYRVGTASYYSTSTIYRITVCVGSRHGACAHPAGVHRSAG